MRFSAILLTGICLAACSLEPEVEPQTDNGKTVQTVKTSSIFTDPSPNIQTVLDEIRAIDPNLTPTDPAATIAAVETARKSAEGILPPNHPAWAALTNLHASAQFYAGDPAAAYTGLQKSYEQFKTADHHPSQESIETLGSLVTIARMRGEPEQSEAYLEEQRIAVEVVQGPSSMDMSQILYNKGAIAFARNEYDVAIEFMTDAVDMSTREYDPDRPEEVERVVGQTTSLAAIYDRTNQPRKATEYNQTASDLAAVHLPAGQPTRLFAQTNYASMLSNQARYAEARRILVDVLEQRRNSPDPEGRDTGLALHSLGFALMKLGREDEAEPYVTEARKIFLQDDGKGEALRATVSLSIMAEVADRTGDYTLATDRWGQADEEYIDQAGTDNTERLPVLLSLSRTAIKRGQSVEAIDYAEEAQRIAAARAMSEHPFGLQADTLSALNNPEARAESLAKTVRLSAQETRLARLSPDHDPGRLSLYHLPLDVAIGLAWRDGDADTALSAMQLRHLDEVAENAIAARLRTLSNEVELRTLQNARQRYAELDRAYLSALATNAPELTDISHQRQAQFDLVDGLLRDMDDSALDWRSTQISDIRTRLEPGQGLLVLHLGDVFPVAALITKADITSASIAQSRPDLTQSITAFRAQLDPANPGGDIDAAAKAAFESLIPEAIATALNDLENVLIYAPGEGTSIPFAALKDTEDQWFGERFGLRVLPTLSNLGVGRALPAEATFLGVGDPKLADVPQTIQYMAALDFSSTGTLMRGSVGDAAAIRTLPSLPATRSELTAMANFFGKSRSLLIMGESATEAAIRKTGFKERDVISFATHALVSGELPGLNEPALVLTPPSGTTSDASNDGLLTRSEITELDINQSWVILSACNTATGRTMGAPGLSGLASAFLYSGADTLMVSHWPVRDDAAAYLSTRAVSGTTDGSAPEAALRRAMAELRRSDLPGADHPAIWAPFVIVGG